MKRIFRLPGGRLIAFLCVTSLGQPTLWGHPGEDGVPHRHDDRVIQVAQADGKRASSVGGADEAVSGAGEWKFRWAKEYRLPEEAMGKLNGAHGGFAVDPETRDLYFGLKGVGIIRLGPKPGDSEILGADSELVGGNLHNTTFFSEKGRRYLACPDNEKSRVFILDLESKELTTLNRPAVNEYYRGGNAFAPTDTEFKDSVLYVADGYSPGNYILSADPLEAKWTERFFGGKGTGQGQFGTAHGVTYNSKEGTLDVADRPHSRIERFDLEGEFQKSVSLPDGAWPCDVDYHDGYAVVGCLFGPGKTTPAPVYILDKEGKVVSTIKPQEDLGFEKAKHIHNASWWTVPAGEAGEGERVMIAVTAWNPGDFFVLERVSGGE